MNKSEQEVINHQYVANSDINVETLGTHYLQLASDMGEACDAELLTLGVHQL
jgi:hypothetical protein